MPLSASGIAEAVARYEREYDRYAKLAELVYERCQGILSRTSVRASVQRRAKAPKSLRKKLECAMLSPAKASQFNTVDDVFSNVSDLAGVRIATYVESDRDRIVSEIKDEFAGPLDASTPAFDKKDGHAKNPLYRATHCQVRIPDDELPENASNLRGATCEIQVCSLLAHVWNEIEHDLSYKPVTGELGPSEKNLLEQLAWLMQAGDISIRELLQVTDARLKNRIGKFIDVHDFVARMRGEFPEAQHFGDYAEQLLDELQRVGLETPDAIKSSLMTVPPAAAHALDLLKEFQNHLASRRETPVPNEDSSDLLLMLLLEQKAFEIVAAHPVGPGKGRPSRLVLFARRFIDMQRVQAATDAQQASG